jgi:hypothetical protein
VRSRERDVVFGVLVSCELLPRVRVRRRMRVRSDDS